MKTTKVRQKSNIKIYIFLLLFNIDIRETKNHIHQFQTLHMLSSRFVKKSSNGYPQPHMTN